MDRITIRHLRTLCVRLNNMTNMPLEAYRKEGNGYVPNPGNFHIDEAYGGYALYRMSMEGTGETDVLKTGHTSARNLYEQIHAFIRGIDFVKDGR